MPVVLIALIALAGLAAPAVAVQPGDPAPDFQFEDAVTGVTIDSRDYAGKVIGLVFYDEF